MFVCYYVYVMDLSVGLMAAYIKFQYRDKTIILSYTILLCTEVPDWGIAVIVVGILALVALIFCLIGVCFACQSTKKTGGGRYM